MKRGEDRKRGVEREERERGRRRKEVYNFFLLKEARENMMKIYRRGFFFA